MSWYLDEFLDWTHRESASLLKKLGGLKMGRKLLTSRSVACVFEKDGVVVISGIAPVVTLIDLGTIELPALDMTIEERVAAGEYDDVTDYGKLITSEKFMVTTTGHRHLYLACFDEHMSNGEIDQVFDSMPYMKEALIEDFLAVGAHTEHRKLQLKFAIHARGASLKMGNSLPRIPTLANRFGKRELNMQRDEGGSTFLLVGKH